MGSTAKPSVGPWSSPCLLVPKSDGITCTTQDFNKTGLASSCPIIVEEGNEDGIITEQVKMSDYGVSVQQLNDLLSDDNGHFSMPTKDFNEVYPRILLGNESVATNVRLLQQLRVTHVLNVADGDSYMHVKTGAEYYAATGIIYHGIPANDVEYFNLSIYFEECAGFIEQALAYKGDRGKVYVHCQKGYSRSATVVIAYLMLKHQLDVQAALATVREKREIGPNDGFLCQLCHLNDKLQNEFNKK